MDAREQDRIWYQAARKAIGISQQLLQENSETYRKLAQEIEENKRQIVVQNLEGSALAFVVSTLWAHFKRPVLVLTAGIERSENLTDDLEYLGVSPSLHYPKWEILPYDDEDIGMEITSKHLDVFESLYLSRQEKSKNKPLVVAPYDATVLKVLPPENLESLTLRFAWGDTIDFVELSNKLDQAGYERMGMVESRGEYSIRGTIIDIYPPNYEDPIRLDLFDNEIESIRVFDLATQRSLKDLGTEVTLSVPGTRLKTQMENAVKEGKELVSFYDLFPKDTIIVLDHPERYEEVGSYYRSAVERQYFDVLKGDGVLGPPDSILLSEDEIEKSINSFVRIDHSRLPQDSGDSSTASLLFRTGNYEVTDSNLESWINEIKKRQSEDYLVVIVCDNDGQVSRFADVLADYQITTKSFLNPEDTKDYQLRGAIEGYKDVLLIVGVPHESFLFHDCRVALITDREIFGRYKRRHIYKKIYKGKPITGSSEIQRNDLVVHVDHGIGRYMGMRQQQIDGQTVDLLELVYHGSDKLLVPVEKIRYVQKFAGNPETTTLDKLGSNKWSRKRKKSREQIEQMAEELLELYARREVSQREPYGDDKTIVKEFESSFPYQETPDQMQAIKDVKSDMHKHRPMDRLVCGDVGYGKTEVALRSVFKCVSEGRQAAILVPTTILALQHYNSFKERYAAYDIDVRLMSRFQKPAEIKEIKKGIKDGSIKVVVGTHKLLGKDVEFQNLSMLVVDEEQRFGVKAKEKLKDLRSELDILTLTATPIPRTLHMAMSGLRELSLITTPPPDRQAIKTRIIHWEEEAIAEAILRELNRGGQIFFVHNRIHNIQEVATQINKIVPHARIGVAHGQMKESELEDHMIKFVQGEYDILISTTIVESGIDIPNANTILINRADAFGLAQLYQLRGRVGREKKRAYSYLIVPKGREVTETAIKRLAAIEEFSELGSGFNIAMRDMEIRGAGNILGKEQHGIVMEIGFELYCDMLNDAVSKLKGEETHDQHDVEIKWPISTFIPLPYIPVESQRVAVYKRLAAMDRQEQVSDLRIELKDRYGELPQGVQNLLEITQLRIVAAHLKIHVIDASGPMIRIQLLQDHHEKIFSKLQDAKKDSKKIESVSSDKPTGFRILVDTKMQEEKVIFLREYFAKLYELLEAESNED